MYGSDFFERMGIPQICEFLRYGDLVAEEEGTLEERYHRHEKVLVGNLRKYRRDVLEMDWTGLSGQQLLFKEEELYQTILDEITAMETVSFEAGFLAGLHLAHSNLR